MAKLNNEKKEKENKSLVGSTPEAASNLNEKYWLQSPNKISVNILISNCQLSWEKLMRIRNIIHSEIPKKSQVENNCSVKKPLLPNAKDLNQFN